MPTLRNRPHRLAVELGLEVPDHRQAGDPTEPDARAKGLDLTAGECDALVAFVASLPAPGDRSPPASRRQRRSGRGEGFRGDRLATCHTPDLGEVARIYSDLLLHDMGADLGDTGSYGTFRPGVARAG